MEKHVFYFKVLLLFDTNYNTSTGLGLATSLSDATEQIEKFFYDDLIAILHLELNEDEDLILLPEDTCLQYMNSDIGDFVKCLPDGTPLTKDN